MLITISKVSVGVGGTAGFEAVADDSGVLGLHAEQADDSGQTFEKLLSRLGKRIDDARAANVKPGQ